MGLETVTQQDRLKGIIKENIAPAMKEAGFKKKGNWFNRQGEDNTDFLNIVSSRWNTGNEVDFTLEAYVMPNGKKPIKDAPIKRQRMEHLREGENYWYKLTPEVNVKELGQVIEQDISKYIMPFFASRTRCYDTLQNFEVKGR